MFDFQLVRLQIASMEIYKVKMFYGHFVDIEASLGTRRPQDRNQIKVNGLDFGQEKQAQIF